MTNKRIISFQIALGLFATILLLNSQNRPSYYMYLFCLPLGYTAIITPLVWCKDLGIPLLTITGVLTIRNILSPIFMYLGSYNSYFYVDSLTNVNKAILLMLYESLVLVGYAFYLNNSYNKKNNNEIRNDKWQNSFSLNQNTMLLITLAFLFSIILFRPGFYKKYTSLFFESNIRKIEASASSSALETLFSVFLPISYIFSLLYFMRIINLKVSNRFIKLLLNFFIYSVPFFFLNNSDGFNLIIVFSLILVSMKINAITKYSFVLLSVISIGIAFYILFSAANLIYDADTKTSFQKLSELFLAYFPGVSNISGGFNLSKAHLFETFFYDLYATIPYRQTLFGLKNDNRLVLYYVSVNDASSQIIPCIIQTFTYFKLFGPFVECILIKFAFRAYKTIESTDNIYVLFVYTFLFIYLVITPVSYNFTIFLARFNITILPMLIIYCHLQIPSSDKVKLTAPNGNVNTEENNTVSNTPRIRTVS